MTPFFERNFANFHTDKYLLGMCSRKKWSFFMTFAIKRRASSPPLPLLMALFSNDFFHPTRFSFAIESYKYETFDEGKPKRQLNKISNHRKG